MNLFKYVYAASIAMMLTAFIACGDDNSSSADDIISDLSPEIDITDSSSSGLPSSSTDNSSISSSGTNNNSVSSSNTDNNGTPSSSTGNSSASSSSSGNNSTISSSSDINSTSSSSSINGSEIAEGCIVKRDTTSWHLVDKDSIYRVYPLFCDGIQLAEIYNETDKNFPITADGQNCTLNDKLDGTVDVTCGTNTYTVNKPSAGGYTTSEPELVSCKETDLWCHNPIIDGTDKSPITQMTYKENEGFFFTSTGTHDLTDWEGICITYTSDTTVSIILDLGEAKNQELNNNLPQASLWSKAILPIEICIPWKSFRQPRWASPFILGQDAAKAVASFKINQPSEGNFKLIRIRTFRDIESYRSDCGDLWCAYAGEDQIYDTGCGEDERGLWKTMTDATSSLTWPEKLGHIFDPNSLLPVIESYASIAGTYTSGNGDNPYAKIGFTLDFDSEQNFDITQWGGICLSYKSTHDFFVELTPFNAANGQEIPRVLIPRSLQEKTIDLTWSSFNPADASAVNSINFVFSEPAGATGYFAFYTVGRAGTCTR